MAGQYTESQKKATEKYLKTQYQMAIRIKYEDADRYKAAAEVAGMSLREYVLCAIEEKIKKDQEQGE